MVERNRRISRTLEADRGRLNDTGCVEAMEKGRKRGTTVATEAEREADMR